MSDSSVDRNYALLEVLVDKSPECSQLHTFVGSRLGIGCSPRHLVETLEVLTATQLELFWSKLNQLATVCITRLGLADDSDEDMRDALVGSAEWSEMVGVLGKITQVVAAFTESSKSRPKSLFTTLATLHDILTLLNCDDIEESHLQVCIAKSCECWWLRGELGRELLVTQLIAYLLLSAVETDDSDVLVKRLHGIKSSFQLLDFDDDSIESIRGLLLRCFVHPRFLKVSSVEHALGTFAAPPHVVSCPHPHRLWKVGGSCLTP